MGRERSGTTRLWVGWAAVALALAACGNVVIDDGAAGTGQTTATSGATGGSASTTTTTSTAATTTTATTVATTTSTLVTGSGTSCVVGCNDAITSGTMPPYGLGFAYYGALVANACSCAACTDNLCAFLLPSASCMACVEANFPIDLQNCIAH